jgi:hypothetical protein
MMAQADIPRGPTKGKRVKTLYDMVNNSTEDEQVREQYYEQIAEDELNKLSKLLEGAIQAKVSMLDFWQDLVQSGELAEMLSVLMIASKPRHRISISYMLERLNDVGGIAQTELAQMAKQQK